MKRAAPSIGRVDRPYTQQPVSCRFCRSRKLKCDRGRPSCFNCNSRNHQCVYETGGSHQTERIVSVDDHVNTNEEELDLAQRVKRLERAVFEKHKDLRNQVLGPAKGPKSQLTSNDEEQQKTSQWLEGLLTTDLLGGNMATPSAIPETSIMLRDFPTYRDATTLLQHFIQTVDATYRTLHHPTVWSLLRVLYENLEMGRAPSRTQFSFFLYIFAGSAYASRESFEFESHSLRGYSQITLAELWARRAVSLITSAPVTASIEALHTIIGLVHLCAQIEGFSGAFETLSMLGLQMAKVMKIHRLDSPSNRDDRLRDGADMVLIETKRRIWWHLVSSDWLLSFVGGHNEGTYMLHPRQMEILRPSNVEDGNIPVGITRLTEESYNLPMSTPTSMSYFLHRIEMATLAREIVDRLPPSYFAAPGKDNGGEVYKAIMNLDQMYQEYFESLPWFFQLTVRDPAAYQVLLKERPYLEWQRYLINLILHTQLARLHRPFLIRGSREVKYRHSRLQCIRSAEIVIDLRNRALSEYSSGSFTYVLQHFLNAAIILAMDVCFSPDRDQAPQRKQQVMVACRALEEELKAKAVPSSGPTAKDVSSGRLMVQSFQDAVQNLRRTIRKFVHEGESDGAVTLPVREALPPTVVQRGTTTNTNLAEVGPAALHPQVEILAARNEHTTEAGAPSETFLVDELWNDLLTAGPTFTETDWDTLFSDLGAKMT